MTTRRVVGGILAAVAVSTCEVAFGEVAHLEQCEVQEVDVRLGDGFWRLRMRRDGSRTRFGHTLVRPGRHSAECGK